jgi:hypothetical protein
MNMPLYPHAAATLLLAALALTLTGCVGGAAGGGAPRVQCCVSISPVKAYPLDKCLVTGEGFDHGRPYSFVHNGQGIKLCCKECLAEFHQDRAKYLARLKPAP